jgi:LPS-assembly protein
MPASEAPPDRVTGRAKRGNYDAESARYTFVGDAVVRRGERQISGERLAYNDNTDTVSGEGGLRLREPGVAVEAKRGEFRLADDTGEAENVHYRFATGHLHGEAARMRFLGEERTRYQDVTVTTCNPGEELWELRASEVTVDQAAGFGDAWNARLAIGGVPVAYTPWLRFPVGRERQTGFLAPTIGRSSDNGFETSTPFYWNIAPNYDATITPTYFSKRGTMLGTEFRYLEPWIQGRLRTSYLPSDSEFGEDRWSIDQEHRLRLGERFRAEIDQERVSDAQYPDDFDTSFDGNTERFLESEGRATWTTSDWSASAWVQNWQTIDPTIAKANQPLAREPSVRLRYDPFETVGPRWVDYSVQAEGTRFTHPVASKNDTGERFDTTARVSLPYERLSYFVEPAVSLRHTVYNLDRRRGVNQAEQLDRTVPIFSLDTGIFLERDAPLFGQSVRQTLEPRLFFLHVPERNQDEIPIFDTQRADLTFAQLFREDRFVGADRVGDATRASWGVTTRWVSEKTGREYVRLSGGGIVHFQDRDVTAPGNEPGTEDLSDLVGEAELNLPGGLSARLDGLIDPDNTGTFEWNTRLRYRGSGGVILNGRYRTRRIDGTRQRESINASAAVPISRRWTVFGGARRDLLDEQMDTAFTGVQYEACCYAVRGVYRSTLDPGARGGTQRDNAFMIQFQLKGLGGVGDEVTSFFRDAVPGYRRR